ncbi:hypothetical protein [Agrobacterium tumefaciens]|uniref:hypothetical protein n=1 Tax=Agrobacterium tumefaciens TaxID=358 RepID=UPI0015735F91|nr:hypothetical protein [Agrobacterium tumefaciens]WCJ65030.1 hypothetical protein G6M15_19375 [Agrobacterium tumefaciens]
MAWSSFIGPAVVAAVVSGIIAVIGMLVTRSTTLGIHREKIEADQLLARQKFDYDKQQAVFKRRFELAEQFLADTYRLKSLLDYVRNGAAFSDEGATREASESESESLKRRRDVYFVPAERLIPSICHDRIMPQSVEQRRREDRDASCYSQGVTIGDGAVIAPSCHYCEGCHSR